MARPRGFEGINYNLKTLLGALSVHSPITRFPPCHYLLLSDKPGRFLWEVMNAEHKGLKDAPMKHVLKWFGAILCVRSCQLQLL